MLSRFLSSVIVAAMVTGCAFRLGDLSVLSTKNTALPIKPVKSTVEGEDCETRLLGLVPISGSLFPNIDEAMDQAMAKVPAGNIMTSIALYDDRASFLLVSKICLRVKCDVGVIE